MPIVGQQIRVRHRVQMHGAGDCQQAQNHQQFVLEQEFGEREGEPEEEGWSEGDAHQGEVENLWQVDRRLVCRFVTQHDTSVPGQKADERESHQQVGQLFDHN